MKKSSHTLYQWCYNLKIKTMEGCLIKENEASQIFLASKPDLSISKQEINSTKQKKHQNNCTDNFLSKSKSEAPTLHRWHFGGGNRSSVPQCKQYSLSCNPAFLHSPVSLPKEGMKQTTVEGLRRTHII